MEGVQRVEGDVESAAKSVYADKMDEQLGRLLMEPLAYRPWEVARLTDSQIAWINRAADRHAKAMNEAKGEGAGGGSNGVNLENAVQSSEADFDAFMRDRVKQA